MREVQELYVGLHVRQKHRGSRDTQDPRSILSSVLSLRAETTISSREGDEDLQNRQVPNQLFMKSSPSKPLTKRGSLMVF